MPKPNCYSVLVKGISTDKFNEVYSFLINDEFPYISKGYFLMVIRVVLTTECFFLHEVDCPIRFNAVYKGTNISICKED